VAEGFDPARLRRLIDVITILGDCCGVNEYVMVLKDEPWLSGCQGLIERLMPKAGLFIDAFVE